MELGEKTKQTASRAFKMLTATIWMESSVVVLRSDCANNSRARKGCQSTSSAIVTTDVQVVNQAGIT